MRPQGRRGEVLAEPLADLALFSAEHPFWLAPREDAIPSPAAERVLEAAWPPTGRNAGRIVLKLYGAESISDAEALAGQFLLMPLAQLPTLDPDTFLVRDLVGCSLFDGNRLAGTIVDVQFPVAADGRTRLEDAPDLLAVQPVAPSRKPSGEQDPGSNPSAAPTEHEPALIPFVRAWLVNVDLAAKRITMQLPPGLFDPAEEA